MENYCRLMFYYSLKKLFKELNNNYYYEQNIANKYLANRDYN